MELDYQKIQHNFMTRIVIFAVFLYKNLRRQEKVYESSVRSFLKKRISQDIDLTLEVGPKMTKEEMRDSLIKSIFDPNDETVILNLVSIRFKTNLMEVNIQVDIDNDQKYENYLYS